MLSTDPSEEVIEWFCNRRQELAANAKKQGSNRTYYWNFSREVKIKFVRLLCQQFEIAEPEFEFERRKVEQYNTTGHGAYANRTIYCTARASHGKQLLKLFFQHKCCVAHQRTKDNYPELHLHSETFATEYWGKMMRAAKESAKVAELPLPLD